MGPVNSMVPNGPEKSRGWKEVDWVWPMTSDLLLKMHLFCIIMPSGHCDKPMHKGTQIIQDYGDPKPGKGNRGNGGNSDIIDDIPQNRANMIMLQAISGKKKYQRAKPDVCMHNQKGRYGRYSRETCD